MHRPNYSIKTVKQFCSHGIMILELSLHLPKLCYLSKCLQYVWNAFPSLINLVGISIGHMCKCIVSFTSVNKLHYVWDKYSFISHFKEWENAVQHTNSHAVTWRIRLFTSWHIWSPATASIFHIDGIPAYEVRGFTVYQNIVRFVWDIPVLSISTIAVIGYRSLLTPWH